MMKLKLSELKNKSMTVFVKSPIEIIMSFVFLLFGIWLTWTSEPYFGSIWYNLKFYFFACVGLAYTMNIAFSDGKGWIFYYLSLLSPVLVYLHLSYGSPSDLSLIIATICAIFLMFVGNGLKNNGKFVNSAIAKSMNLFLSGALSGIAVLALMAVYASFVYIFDLGLTGDEFLLMILDFGMYAFFPFLFLLFEYNEKYGIRHNRFSEILFNYILTPAIVLFGVILYIYFAKIIVLWELPKGGISATAIAFLAGGIIVKACRITLDKRIWNWFFDFFSFVALPALGMLWIAVMYRVMEYGFTDKRIYLLVSVVVLTVWIFAQFFKRTNVYHYLTIFTVFIFLFFTYAPFINANAVQKRIVANEPKISEKGVINNRNVVASIEGVEDDIDITGYKHINSVDETIENDTLSVYSHKDGELLFRMSVVDLFDSLMQNCGLENYQELSLYDISSLKKPLVYRDDAIILIFKSIDFRVVDGKYTPFFVNIKSAITKD